MRFHSPWQSSYQTRVAGSWRSPRRAADETREGSASMRPKLHFISGLPRSGSTLLAGILHQNPRFHAAMTGPVGNLFNALLNAMSPQNETALFLTEEQKRNLLR